MTNEKVKLIVDNNRNIILKFITIMCAWFNINIESLKDMQKESLKFHIKNALIRVKVDEFKLSQLRREIEEKGHMLEEFEKAFVSGDSYDKISEGKNTGGKPNNMELRQIQKIKLKEEQQQRIIDYDLSERKIREKHEAIKDFISLLPQAHFIVVMELTFFRNLSNGQIANQTNYEICYVDQIRHRALNELCKMIKNYF